ncbi:MAG: hypothetical protein HKN56_08570 [Gammaproteobacteria bacterium]|nr:hypothetical protein [Gammaproteobacteria bacterium]
MKQALNKTGKCSISQTYGQGGAALAITLMLLAFLSLAGISGLRAATVALRLSTALQDADQAFALSTRAIDHALTTARDDPASLPASGTQTLPTLRDPAYPESRADGEIRFAGTQSCPAPLTGTRYDYEIRVTATAGRGALSHQRQHFYYCRPACSTPPCAETGPVKSGWQVTQPD